MLRFGVQLHRSSSTRRPALRRLCRVLAVLVVVIVGAFARPAHGQMGGMFGMSGATMDGLSRRSVDAMAAASGMNADQKEALMMLYDGHRAARKKLTDDFQNGIKALSEKFREEQDFSVWRTDMPKLSEKFQKDVRDLERDFLTNAKSLLTPEQADSWSKAERVHRRSKFLRVALMSGQAVDLVEVTRTVAADAAAKGPVAETLDAYELQMDRMLESYEKLANEAQDKARDMAGGGMGNPNAMQEMMKPIVDKAGEIRNLNRDFARRIAPMLSESQQLTFSDEVKRKSHPRVYRETHIEKSIEAALKFSDLDAGQRTSLADLQSSFRRDAGPLNDGWAKAIEEKEDKGGGVIGVMMQGFMNQGAEDEVSKARKARRALEDQAQQKLNAILREEQRAKLPEKKPEGGNPWDFFNTGDDKDDE